MSDGYIISDMSVTKINAYKVNSGENVPKVALVEVFSSAPTHRRFVSYVIFFLLKFISIIDLENFPRIHGNHFLLVLVPTHNFLLCQLLG